MPTLSATEADLACVYYPRETGLEGIIIAAGPRGKLVGEPCLKVALRDKLGDQAFDAVVSIGPSPGVIQGELPSAAEKLVALFVRLNQAVLERLWNEEISCPEAASEFEKITIVEISPESFDALQALIDAPAKPVPKTYLLKRKAPWER